MTELVIRLTRLSPTHHRFEARRPDGSAVTRELETRSFLMHDLAHFAVESEAGLQGGFYGRLARGEDDSELSGEAEAIERFVGALQGAAKGDIEARGFFGGFAAYLNQIGVERPAWLSADFTARVLERLRRLLGQWRATPFHETMELRFPLTPAR